MSAQGEPTPAARRVLEPEERISEVLFGLIMVITFTGSLSVAEAGRDDVRAMVIGAIGCNLAWGIIDGVLYLLNNLADRGRRRATLVALQQTPSPNAERLLAERLPPLVASVLEPGELQSLCERLKALPVPRAAPRLTWNDGVGALAIFLLVFVSTLPVAVPFVFVHDIPHAMRISNAIAVALLFVTGVAYGRVAGRSQFGFGLGFALLGSLLVALTIALGG